jgi:hypothetical protein
VKFFSIDASPLWLLLGGFLVFSLPASCGRLTGSTLRQLDLLRRHRTSVDDPAQRELIVRGKATPSGSAVLSPSGRSCLAWNHSVKALRTSGSGKKKSSSFVEICSRASKGPVGIEAQGHAFSAEGLRLELAVHKTDAKAPKPLIPCPAFRESDGASAVFVEHCLLEGDAVEAWGCRSSRSGALLPCHDGADLLASPPGKGPIEPRRSEALTQLCLGALLLLLGASAFIAWLDGHVSSTLRGRKSGNP